MIDLSSDEFGLWRTHQPLLLAILAVAPPGPVLELGSGYGSTVILHAACAATGRRLLTIDGNSDWAQKFSSLATPDHSIVSVNGDWSKAPSIYASDWAVVFVDHAPAERRMVDITALADRCEYMVVHDTEDEAYGYDFSGFKYRFDYKRMRPWTSVVSNRREVPRGI